MLQGLDIPWGVMVDTWDLTFSSTSDVPDRLELCPTVQAVYTWNLSFKHSPDVYDGISFPASLL